MMTLYVPALEGIRNCVGAEATALMLLDHRNEELYTEVIDGPLPKHRTKLGEGIIGSAVETGQTLTVDLNDTGWFNKERHRNYQGTGMDVRSELVVPLMDTSM